MTEHSGLSPMPGGDLGSREYFYCVGKEAEQYQSALVLHWCKYFAAGFGVACGSLCISVLEDKTGS